MAENKLEGFEDFDNLLGESEEGEESGGGDFGGELDELLGEEAGAGGGGDEGESDSELDSFFEDLSTIDDLEVLQDEEQPAEEEPQPAAAAAAAPAAAAAEERERPQPRRERKAAAPREPGRFRAYVRRLMRWIVLLALLGAAAYAAYWWFYSKSEIPWMVEQQEQQPQPRVVQPQPQPEPEPEPAPEPEPEPEPEPPPPEPEPSLSPPPSPAKPEGPTFGIQVATCFFTSCVEGYRSVLQAENRVVRVSERTAESEALEIYSTTTYADRVEAQAIADRINREHRLEGHAYLFRDSGGYKISMGAFSDLQRANVVRDSLNQQFGGEVEFGTRLKNFPYTLKSVVAGSYISRESAEAALERLKASDSRFADAFVVQNP